MKKTIDPVMENHRRTPVLFIFAVFLLALMIAGTFYLSFTKTAIANQQAQLDADLKDLNSQINALKGQKVEAEQFSKKYLSELQKNEIRWSEVIKSVKALVPTDPATQKPKIHFLSYAGSVGGKLSLNAETIPAPRAPFSDVSELLSVFNSSSFFKDAYIPSVNRGVSETGNILLSFTFNVTYGERTPDMLPTSNAVPSTTPVKTDMSGSSSSQQAGDETPIKVPRK